MDLSYTAAEEEFRAELRTWLAANVPQEWRRPGFWAVAARGRELPPAPRLGARQGRRRVRGHPMARRVRRPRRHPRHEGDLRRGDGAGRRAAHRQRARPHLPRTHGHGHRHRRAEEGDHRADAAQRGDLVPGLLRARRGIRPRGAGLPRRPRRRRLRGQRPEGVDHQRRARRQDLRAGPHGSRRGAPPGHLDAADRHAPARRRRPAAQADERGQRVRRGVLHRRARARHRGARRHRRRLAHRDAAALLRARRVGHQPVHRVPPPVRRDRRPRAEARPPHRPGAARPARPRAHRPGMPAAALDARAHPGRAGP